MSRPLLKPGAEHACRAALGAEAQRSRRAGPRRAAGDFRLGPHLRRGRPGVRPRHLSPLRLPHLRQPRRSHRHPGAPRRSHPPGARLDARRDQASGPRAPSRRATHLRVTPAMSSLLGASGEDFAVILKGLGYRMERRPKPPEPMPTPLRRRATADARGAAARPRCCASEPGEPAPDAPPTEEPPVEEPTVEPPTEEPPAEPPAEEPPVRSRRRRSRRRSTAGRGTAVEPSRRASDAGRRRRSDGRRAGASAEQLLRPPRSRAREPEMIDVWRLGAVSPAARAARQPRTGRRRDASARPTARTMAQAASRVRRRGKRAAAPAAGARRTRAPTRRAPDQMRRARSVRASARSTPTARSPRLRP